MSSSPIMQQHRDEKEWLEDFREAKRSILQSKPHVDADGLRSPPRLSELTEINEGHLGSSKRLADGGPANPPIFTLQLYQETNQNIGKLKSEIKSIMDMLLLEQADGGGGGGPQRMISVPSHSRIETLCPPSSSPPPPPPPHSEEPESILPINHHHPHPPSAPAPNPPRPETSHQSVRSKRPAAASTKVITSPERGRGGCSTVKGDPKERVRASDLQQLLLAAPGADGGRVVHPSLSSPLTSSSSSSSSDDEAMSPDASGPRSFGGNAVEAYHHQQQRDHDQQPHSHPPRSNHRRQQNGGDRRDCLDEEKGEEGVGDVDGLDHGGQNYSYLLAMMREERQAARRQEYRINELEHEVDEVKQECAVSLDGAKLECLGLKRMLRRMAVESTFADVFQVYEAHISRVEKEVHALRERNVQLELRAHKLLGSNQPGSIGGAGGEWSSFVKILSVEEEDDGDDGASRQSSSLQYQHNNNERASPGRGGKGRYGGGGGGGESSSSASSSPARQRLMSSKGMLDSHLSRYLCQSQHTEGLRKQVKELQREVSEMMKENAELRRRERQFMVQKRMVEGTWARVHKIQGMAKEMESNLANCRLEAARSEARLAQAEDEVRALRRNEERLKMDKDKACFEMELMQKQFARIGLEAGHHGKEGGGGGNGHHHTRGLIGGGKTLSRG